MTGPQCRPVLCKLQLFVYRIVSGVYSPEIGKVVSKVCTFLLQNLLQHREDIAPYASSLLEEEKPLQMLKQNLQAKT